MSTVSVQSEEGSGFRLIAAGALECLDDEAALELLEVDPLRRQVEILRGSGGRRQRREILRLESLRVGEQHRALDDVSQLAHVARPSVLLEQRVRRRARPDDAFPEFCIEGVDKIFDEQEDILGVGAQGRNGNWQYVQTVIEIATEAPLGDLLFEIAVRRRDHADVDANVLSPADPLERFLLEKAQQLRLQRGYHLADLVEKDGAPISRLQQSTFL